MIESSYSKLFSSIVTSTIWREDDKTRIVWITLLALKNRHGQVAGSIPGLAVMANVSIPDCQAALDKLSSPDPYSRSKEFEGRRIETVDGGWQVLNHGKYRDAMSIDERRAYQAAWQKRYRARKKQSVDKPVDACMSTLTQADTDADTDTDAVPLNNAFGEWIKTIDAMWPSQLDATKVDLQRKLSRARSPYAKAEWKRRLEFVENRRLGPPVPDATEPVKPPEPPAPPVDPVKAEKLISELKSTVAAVVPVRPTVKVMKQVRFKRPEKSP